MADQWFYMKDGQQFGPLSGSQLKHLAQSGQLQPADLIWKKGLAEWRPSGRISGLFPAAPPQPVPVLAKTRPPVSATAVPPQSTAGVWYLQTPDGQKHGPKSKAELDAWFVAGSITAACQILEEGWPQWKWASEVYSALAESKAAVPPNKITDDNFVTQAADAIRRSHTPLASRSRKKQPQPKRKLTSKQTVMVVASAFILGSALFCLGIFAFSRPHIVLPADQAAFVKAVDTSAKLYAAANDFKKSTMRAERRAKLEKAVPTRSVTGWLGTLVKAGTQSDGRAYVEIKLSGSRIAVFQTWTTLVTDSSDHTLIRSGSSLYKSVADLLPGDSITFSGQLIPSENDFVFERSITEKGSMTDPAFIIRVEEIRKGHDLVASSTIVKDLPAIDKHKRARWLRDLGVTGLGFHPDTDPSRLAALQTAVEESFRTKRFEKDHLGVLESFDEVPPPILQAVQSGHDVWLLAEWGEGGEEQLLYIVISGNDINSVITVTHVENGVSGYFGKAGAHGLAGHKIPINYWTLQPLNRDLGGTEGVKQMLLTGARLPDGSISVKQEFRMDDGRLSITSLTQTVVSGNQWIRTKEQTDDFKGSIPSSVKKERNKGKAFKLSK